MSSCHAIDPTLRDQIRRTDLIQWPLSIPRLMCIIGPRGIAVIGGGRWLRCSSAPADRIYSGPLTDRPSTLLIHPLHSRASRSSESMATSSPATSTNPDDLPCYLLGQPVSSAPRRHPPVAAPPPSTPFQPRRSSPPASSPVTIPRSPSCHACATTVSPVVQRLQRHLQRRPTATKALSTSEPDLRRRRRLGFRRPWHGGATTTSTSASKVRSPIFLFFLINSFVFFVSGPPTTGPPPLTAALSGTRVPRGICHVDATSSSLADVAPRHVSSRGPSQTSTPCHLTDQPRQHSVTTPSVHRDGPLVNGQLTEPSASSPSVKLSVHVPSTDGAVIHASIPSALLRRRQQMDHQRPSPLPSTHHQMTAIDDRQPRQLFRPPRRYLTASYLRSSSVKTPLPDIMPLSSLHVSLRPTYII